MVFIPSKRKSVFVAPLLQTPGYMLMSWPAFKDISLYLVTEFNDVLHKWKTISQGSTLLPGDAPDFDFIKYV